MQFSSSVFSRFVLLAGVVHSQTTTDFWEQIGGDIDGEAAFDQSGSSVSLSSDGKTVAIGAIYNFPNPSDVRAGHVRIKQYVDNTDTWVQIGDDIDGEFLLDQSGYSVSLSANGTRVAIGGWKNSDGFQGNYEGGHVRVFEYNSTHWNQLGSDLDGDAALDQSGNAVAMNAYGDIVAVGSALNDGNGSDSGQVRVYQWNATAWEQKGDSIVGEAQGDYFGTSVALSDSGLKLAVGATNNDGTAGENSGHVRVYSWKNTDWEKLGDDIDGESPQDNSGISVALSGDGTYVAVGAYYNNGNGGGEDVGHVRVWHHLKNDGWTQDGDDIDGENSNDEFGRSVSLSQDGTILAVGAWKNDGVNGTNSGHVRVHKFEDNVWTQLGQDIDGEATLDESGRSVAIDDAGDTVAIGAWYNTGANGKFSGHTRVYELTKIVTPRGGGQSDPIILGFHDQVFKFEGRDGGWYSNLATKNMQWNMQFRKFDSCPKDADMFISGMSIASFDDNAKRLNSILIATTPEPTHACMADPNMVCLGEGTLHISLDGGETFLSQPGDFHFGSGARIVAHNTYAACSRKWHDYEVSEAKGKNKLRNNGRYLASHLEKKPIELLIKNKAEMIDKTECSTWIKDRVEGNDLFQQRGHWSTVYVETSLASFQIEYRRSDFFNPECDFQSLDAWMTKVDPKLERSGDWNGILGETKHKIFDQTTGEQIKTDRSRLLRSTYDADYEVSEPFQTEFAALTMASKPGSLGQMAASVVESVESSFFSSN